MNTTHPPVEQPFLWQPIETAPKAERILCFYGATSQPAYVCEASWRPLGVDKGYWVTARHSHRPSFDKGSQPTHWMPLPAGPEKA